MKGNIILLNEQGNLLFDTNIENIKLKENGIELPIVDFKCDINSEKVNLSAILSVDLSLSMKGEAFELSKLGANAFIDSFDESNEEVAINGFSDFSILISDFTNNKNSLRTNISEMFLIGGTNFNEAFLNPKYGSLQIANRAKNTPVIIILTDGFANGRTDDVINQAKKIGAKVYSIVLYNSVPKFLKDVSDQTGGLVFDYIDNVEDIIKAYETIYKVSQNINACEIVWKSDNCETKRILEYEYLSVKKELEYEVENAMLSSFEYPNSMFLSFKGVEFGDDGRRLMQIKVMMDTITINDIINDNNKFEIVLPQNVNFPITIPKDSLFEFFVDFRYDEEGFQYSKFTILSDVCRNNLFYASGGVPFGNQSKYIEIIEPNGGEVYFKGVDSLIKWQANEENDKLIIEFSSDKGRNWKEIANNYQGYELKHKYPTVISNECLIRITKLSDSLGYEYLITNTDSTNNNCISWQPSGSSIIMGGTDGYIRFVDGFTHYNLYKHFAHRVITDVEWAPDAIRYASSGDDGQIKIWFDGQRNAIDSTKANNPISCIEWSPDGNRLISGDRFGNLQLWNPADMSLVKELKISQRQINDIRYSPDGSKIAVALSDTSICVLFANSFQQLMKYPVHRGAVTSLDWINNDWIVSVSSQAFNNQVLLSSSVVGQQISSYPINETLKKVRVSRDNNLFSFVGSNGKIHVWGTNDFKEKFNIESKTSWSSEDLAWSPDKTRIVIASNGKNSGQTLKFNSIKQFPEYRTQSDSTFSLVDYKLFADIIDFGRVLVNRVKDTIVNNYIRIESELGIQIDSIRIVNDPNNAFNLVRKESIILNENDNYFVEMSFSPKREMNYNARLEIFTKQNKYIKNVSGVGYLIGIDDYELDFGDIEVNSSERKQLSISNNSDDDIQIDSVVIIGPNLNVFSLVQGNTQSVLKSNNSNSKNLVFEFSPIYGINYSSLAYIYFQDKDAPARIFINGRGIKAKLSYKSEDYVFSECNNNNEYFLEFENEGLLDLEIDNLKSDEVNFSESSFIVKPNQKKIVSGIIQKKSSGTYNIEYSFNSNDSENNDISNTFNYVVEDSKIEIEKDIIEFYNTQLNVKSIEFITITNIEEKSITWDYQLPFQINGSDFYIENIFPTSLNQGESSTFEISFTRKDNLDKLEILTLEDACENRYELSLRSDFNENQGKLTVPDKIDIDVFCTEKKDTLINIVNNSDFDVEITNIRSSYVDKSDIVFPFIIERNSQYILKYNINNLSSSFTETIEIEYNGTKVEIPIEVRLLLSKLDLIEQNKIITINNSGETVFYFTVTNKGTNSEFWENISNEIDNIEFLGISPIPTLPNETATFTFKYNLLKENDIQISIIDECGNEYIQNISLMYGDIPQLDIKISDLNSNIGDINSIEITLDNFKNFDLNEKQGIIFDLVYNTTLLESNRNYSIYGDLAFENITLRFDELIDSKWILSDYQTLWGNDSTSKITIDDMKFIENDEVKVVNIDEGLLRVIDLCQIGGTRLYLSGSINHLEGVYPNPIQNNSNIIYKLHNEVLVEISIITYTGEIIFESKYKLNKDNNKIILPSNLISGSYIIRSQIIEENLKLNKPEFKLINVIK